ncbi:MAG: transposase, partial [Vicinamibacterales bacterium]
FYMHYNFVRLHQSLRVTPAIEAGLTQHVWSIQDLVAMVDASSESKVA